MTRWRIYAFVLVAISMVASFAYLRLSGANSMVPAPISPALEQTVVTDAAILERTNPAFYQGVRDGDIVLRYENRLDLYRPNEERVIRSVPSE